MAIINYKYNLATGQTVTNIGSASSAGSASSVGSASSAGSVAQLGSVGDLSLNTIVDNFVRGNLTLNEAKTGLTAKGAKNIKTYEDNGKICIEYQLNNVVYTIACDKEAAASQTDSNTVNYYTVNSLKNTYKFSDKIISEYFDPVKLEGNNVTAYALKEGCKYSSVSELNNALYTQYKNDLIIDNLLADKNREATSTLDYRKTGDGKLLTSTNYMQYAEEINLATGEEADKIRKQAVDKFILDFAIGDIAYSQVSTILDAIGVENKKQQLSNNTYTITFTFNGKNYSVSCGKAEAAKGNDEVRAYNYYELKTAIAETQEDYQNETDPVKSEELRETLDKTREEYQKVLQGLADAGYLETKKSVEHNSATRTDGVAYTETEEIYENGQLVMIKEIQYDHEGNVVQTIITDKGSRYDTVISTYDAQGYKIEEYIENGSLQHFTNYYYDEQGNSLGNVRKTVLLEHDCRYSEGDPSFCFETGDYYITENGCDSSGQPLVGFDGEPIDSRRTYYHANGDEKSINSSGAVTQECKKDGNVKKLYDGSGDIVYSCSGYYPNYNEAFYEYNCNTLIRETYYENDESWITEMEHDSDYSLGTLKKEVTYRYGSDGCSQKTSTIINADGGKTITIEDINPEGITTKLVTEEYDIDGNLTKRTEISQQENKVHNVSLEDEQYLLSVNKSVLDLSTWDSEAKGAGWFLEAKKEAIDSITSLIDVLGDELRYRIQHDISIEDVVTINSAVDSAVTTLKNYYTALIDGLYDDDDGYKRKGETCEVNFEYADANGNIHLATDDFRHYAFGLESRAENHGDDAAQEAKSGIGLIENTGKNHSYKITVSAETVMRKLIEIFNAL